MPEFNLPKILEVATHVWTLRNGLVEVEAPQQVREEVDGQDLGQTRQRDHHLPFQRHGAAGQPGARASGDEGHPVAVCDPHAVLHLRRGVG